LLVCLFAFMRNSWRSPSLYYQQVKVLAIMAPIGFSSYCTL
jgi:hypothetical protein